MQKKDYNPLLSNCDSLIEEAITLSVLKEIGLAFKQGLMLMVERYVSIPTLSHRVKEFFNVLSHPFGGHANKVWEAQLKENIVRVKSSLPMHDNFEKLVNGSKTNIDKLLELKELADSNNGWLQKKIDDVLTVPFKEILDNRDLDKLNILLNNKEISKGIDLLYKTNSYGVNEIKNNFHSTAFYTQLYDSERYGTLAELFERIYKDTPDEVLQYIKKEGVTSIVSNFLVKLGSSIDSGVAASIHSSIFGIIAAKVYSYFKDNHMIDEITNQITTQDLVELNTPINQSPITPQSIPNVSRLEPTINHSIDQSIVTSQSFPDNSQLINHHDYATLAGGLAAGGLASYALYKHLKK